jgi:hypothetical protein
MRCCGDSRARPLTGTGDVKRLDSVFADPYRDAGFSRRVERVANQERLSVSLGASHRPFRSRVVARSIGRSQNQCRVGVANVPFGSQRSRHVRGVGTTIGWGLHQRKSRRDRSRLARAPGGTPSANLEPGVLGCGQRGLIDSGLSAGYYLGRSPLQSKASYRGLVVLIHRLAPFNLGPTNATH